MRNDKGQFTQGNTGKPKGAKNRITSEIRSKLEDILNEQTDTIKNDLMKLSPKDRVRAYTELLKYAIPTKKDIEVSDRIPAHIEQILNMNESDLKTIYDV